MRAGHVAELRAGCAEGQGKGHTLGEFSVNKVYVCPAKPVPAGGIQYP